MVLIDFTDEEIRNIFQHYPTPHYHQQIWSKLLRSMAQYNTPPPDVNKEIQRIMNDVVVRCFQDISVDVHQIHYRMEKLEADVVDLKNRKNRQ